MSQQNLELIEIRCPFKNKSKTNGRIYVCNRVCVKVGPGSYGEARCRNCHLDFEFHVDRQAHQTTGVRVQPSSPKK